MKEIKHLDEVLEYLFKLGFAHISEKDLQNDLKEKGYDFSDKAFAGGDNSQSRLELILEKLYEDGYINRWEANTIKEGKQTKEKRVCIKYNGILFPGYELTFRQNKNQIQYARIRDRLLIVGSWLAGIGTILLFLIELWKLVYPTCD